MDCKHTTTITLRTTCYTGPVRRDENPAAHGGICITEECCKCGARRQVNLNGQHMEEGGWGDTRTTRLAKAQAARAKARQAIGQIKPVTVQDAHGRRVEVRVDDEGLLALRAHGWSARFADDEEVGIAVASGLVPSATTARQLVLTAEQLAAEV